MRRYLGYQILKLIQYKMSLKIIDLFHVLLLIKWGIVHGITILILKKLGYD